MGRKWSNIKDKKAALDKSRGQVYTRILADITKAVKNNGDNPESNYLLKIMLDKGKKFNVPRDNIERAIKKGMGGADDGYHEINYEGYGIGGVAIFVEAYSNNPTRTAANVRNCFTKCGGTIGVSGCLQFVFEHKSVFEIPVAGIDEDSFTMDMIDAGAEDITTEDGDFIVTGPMEKFGPIQKKLQELKISASEANLERVPLNFKKINAETYKSITKLIGMLEDDEDVNKVYHNIEYDEALFNE